MKVMTKKLTKVAMKSLRTRGSDKSDDFEDEDKEDDKPKKNLITDNSTTLFIRNLPFTTLDADLKEHFSQFGPVRYARVVMDRATDRPRGTGFVCFFNVEDADACFRKAPRHQPTGANAITPKSSTQSSKTRTRIQMACTQSKVGSCRSHMRSNASKQ